MAKNERCAQLEKEIADSTALYESLIAERNMILPVLKQAKHIAPFDFGSIRSSYENKIEAAMNRALDAKSELAWIKRKGVQDGGKVVDKDFV